MPEQDWANLHPGLKAMQHVARILEQRPKKDDHELSYLTRCLGDFRAELIDKRNGHSATPEDRTRLSHLNAIVSVAMAMHFPIGNPPWDEFEKTQKWLKTLVEEIEA